MIISYDYYIRERGRFSCYLPLSLEEVVANANCCVISHGEENKIISYQIYGNINKYKYILIVEMNNKATRGNGFLETYLATRRANLADKNIPDSYRKGKILDIGCGSSPLFLESTSFRKKVGIDYSIKQSHVKNGIKLYNWEIKKNLPFKDSSFDVVTMLAVFEHIEPSKLPFLLKEIHRILRPSGVYIMTTPCVWSDKLLRTMALLNIVSSEEISEHKDAYNHKRIKEYLKEAGFKERNIRLGYFEFFLNNECVAKK